MFQKHCKMHLIRSSSLFILIILRFILFDLSTAIDCGVLNLNDPSQVAYSITVEKSGQGNFTTVQNAIDSVPSGNNQWVRIHVNPGVYTERVSIEWDKPCIFLEGSGSTQSIIAWNGSDCTDTSATFTVRSDNFVAKSIAFQNSFNRPVQNPDQDLPWKPAVAARIEGDKSSFHECAFIGLQDTLWDAQGSHYFNSCYIEGAVDFIWGGGQSVYEDAVINVTSSRLAPEASAGYITAQGRESQSDPSGFLFLRGKISGSGEVYLGRAYRPYSTVVFQGTEMDAAVVPQGWDAWHYVGQEKNFMYAEVDCSGPGWDMSKRVEWERNPNDPDLQNFLNSFPIDRRKWIANQP